ncbi:hypothetical protein BDB01DRAFT_794218 [Pilobolus umbonatus]|nr:hypothetical protein BDB01DRAFT_794218 [Pilobolus umbonatus]
MILTSLFSDGGLYSEDTLSDHIMNLEDHRHSPIILTPRTLSFILDHQWENEAADVHPSSAFKREYNCSTDHDNKVHSHIVCIQYITNSHHLDVDDG